MIKGLFSWGTAYLPVVVPFLLVLFSVVARFWFSRTRLQSLAEGLKIYTDLGLGLLSFVVWGLITLVQTDGIALNETLEITKPNFVLLLILDFFVIFVGHAAARHDWTPSTQTLETFRWFSGSRREVATDTGLLLVTIFFFLVPIALASPIPVVQPPMPASRMHVVVVPFTDPSIGPQVGRDRWGSRLLCDVEYVRATDAEGAKRAALDRIAAKGGTPLLFPERASEAAVTVDSDRVVAALFQ